MPRSLPSPPPPPSLPLPSSSSPPPLLPSTHIDQCWIFLLDLWVKGPGEQLPGHAPQVLWDSLPGQVFHQLSVLGEEVLPVLEDVAPLLPLGLLAGQQFLCVFVFVCVCGRGGGGGGVRKQLGQAPLIEPREAYQSRRPTASPSLSIPYPASLSPALDSTPGPLTFDIGGPGSRRHMTLDTP